MYGLAVLSQLLFFARAGGGGSSSGGGGGGVALFGIPMVVAISVSGFVKKTTQSKMAGIAVGL